MFRSKVHFLDNAPKTGKKLKFLEKSWKLSGNETCRKRFSGNFLVDFFRNE